MQIYFKEKFCNIYRLDITSPKCKTFHDLGVSIRKIDQSNRPNTINVFPNRIYSI
jgi:hypothetical protein